MVIPSSEHPAWAELIEGKRKVTFKFLAIRILLGRLALKYKVDPTPGTRAECIRELIEFFNRNIHLPLAQEDLNAIVGGGL